jgi:hypothetical protein
MSKAPFLNRQSVSKAPSLIRQSLTRDVASRVSHLLCCLRVSHLLCCLLYNTCVTGSSLHASSLTHAGQKCQRCQAASKLRASGELPALPHSSKSGEKVRELSVSNMIDDMLGGPTQPTSPKVMLQDYTKFKHGKESATAHGKLRLNTSNSICCPQALVHHKHVMHMPHDFLDAPES